MKLKNIWKKIKDIFLPKPEPTKKDIFMGLYAHIKQNHPKYLAQTCHCGNFLNHKNIDIQFNNEFVWVIFECPKCNQNLERRYDYSWNLLRD